MHEEQDTFILVDTNIFWNDFLLKGGHISDLLSHCARNNYKILVSEIVLEEIKANFNKNLSISINQFNKAFTYSRQLVDFESVKNTANQELSRVWTDLLSKPFVQLVDYQTTSLDDIVHRCLSSTKPFKSGDGDAGLKDTLIWLSYVSYINDIQSDTHARVVYICKNIKDFADETGEMLHKDLLKDFDSDDLSCELYQKIDEFLTEDVENKSVVEQFKNDIDKDLTELVQLAIENYSFDESLEKWIFQIDKFHQFSSNPILPVNVQISNPEISSLYLSEDTLKGELSFTYQFECEYVKERDRGDEYLRDATVRFYCKAQFTCPQKYNIADISMDKVTANNAVVSDEVGTEWISLLDDFEWS